MKMKGQVVGQVFMFMLAIIIFSGVLLYGYKAVGTFMGEQERVELLEFQDLLGREVDRIALKHGSVKRIDVRLPSVFNRACFVDVEAYLGSDNLDMKNNLSINEPMILRNMEGGAKQNVFLFPPPETPITLDSMRIDEAAHSLHYFCIENKGGPLALRLRGQGGKALVSAWTE